VAGRPHAAWEDDADVAEAVAKVTAALPGGGENRPGQLSMAQAVDKAIAAGRHLVVSAGTGTGKSLAYLVPAARCGRPVVVATATKALQDQLATKDLPLVADHADGHRLTFTVLKGRSNYLCRQRAAEMEQATADPGLAGLAVVDDDGGADHVDLGRLGGQLRQLLAWAATSDTGDRAELSFEPHPRAWSALSVTARECPGAYRCPSGSVCFAERARERAAAADVVVVNTHLYATHVAGGSTVLPPHDVVVLDEAHAVEDVMAGALGTEITPGRFRAVAQAARAVLAGDDARLADEVVNVADRLESVLEPRAGQRVFVGERRHASADVPTGTAARGDPSVAPAVDDDLDAVLALARGRLEALVGALHRTEDVDDNNSGPRRARALSAAGHLADDSATVASRDDSRVVWVEAGGPAGRARTLRAAPIDVGPVLAERLWPNVTAILTSATVPPLLETRLGLPPATTDHLEVPSPFPFESCALLYCAAHLPDPRHADAVKAVHEELRQLITAAGGRTLALFTSWRAMHAAVDALRPGWEFPVLAQGDMPKARLLDAFSTQDAACLFATMSFWQGVDVPGPTLSLVAVDRLPFPRVDDPLVQARRDNAGAAAFSVIDLPRAATLLAQGAGRLIRSSQDTGVVAVLDPRLARARYRGTLLAALPPMRRTVRREEVVSFLRTIAAGQPAAPSAAGQPATPSATGQAATGQAATLG
jgi:ATP-dependent DNA helicase DinG